MVSNFEAMEKRYPNNTRIDITEETKLSNEVAENLPLTNTEPENIDSESISINASVLPVINYAMQQNGSVAIQSITIANNTDSIIENIELCITASPEFALPFTRHIDHLPAKKSIVISRPKITLNAEYLAGITERISGFLHIEIKSDNNILAFNNTETTVLAFDEWQGLGTYPEMLCTFITPNHPELAKIIGRATEFLGEWTGDTAMDGYQSQDPNRVLSQAAAIFTAIKELSIAYVVPPASFEESGQRIRLCDMILQQKLGTCLDLTLFYAACLEAVGLHPLLITTPGHIFPGVWLEDSMFPECIQDDVSLITKRLAAGVNEIAVIEMTCVTGGKDVSFDEAKAIGEQNLTKKNVEYILDVQRARLSHIYPLPQRVHTDSGWEIKHDNSFKDRDAKAPTKLDDTIEINSTEEDESIAKKVQWERKLLDLGMRNTLINLRLTKTQLPILTSSLDDLENALADGSDFTILSKPSDLRIEDFSFDTLSEMGNESIIKAEFENNRLRSVLTEGELAKTVKGLYRTAKASLEENGANTLYLAMGMLRWFENKRSVKPRYAPIILIPIEIVRKSAAQGYVIRLRDDEPQMNITLLEKLKQDFGIIINGIDPLPCDEHGIDIRMVLTVMRKAIMEQSHWDVLEVASIGIFSFSQFVMWNDIRNRTDDLMRNKVVRSLIEGKLCWDAEPLEIEDRVDENNVLLPMPADASQLYAIKAACKGESFVLHGPPGTGKSQTITSLIANALAMGKSVLFVAEKMAALEVVQKRLDSIGIGPFCLELHSNKSKKKDVLEQLRIATEVTKSKTAEEFAAKAEQIAAMRTELDAYARQLHEILGCGSNLYTLINEYEQYKSAPDIEAFKQNFIQKITRQDIENQQLIMERLITAAEQTGHPQNHPLSNIKCTQYTQSLRNSLQTTLQAYVNELENIIRFVNTLLNITGETQPTNYAEFEKLKTLVQNMKCFYDVPSAWAKTTSPKLYFGDISALAEHSLKANTLEKELLQNFDSGFLALDGKQLFAEFTEASAKWFLPRFLGINKLVKTLRAYAKIEINKENLRNYIVKLRDFQSESISATALLNKYGQDLGDLYNKKSTDWNLINKLATVTEKSAKAIYDLYGNYDFMNRYCGKPELREAVFGISEGFEPFAAAKKDFDTLLSIVQITEENWLNGQIELCKTISDHTEELKEWIAYVGASEEAKKAGLENVILSYENGAKHTEIFASYKKALLQGLISNAIDKNGELNNFSGAVFNKKIEQFKRMDQELTLLAQREIYYRLASKVPNFTKEAAHSSELGILQRNIKSGGRGVSLRKLFDQIPNLLSRLCPCMLMSPISAAQYLDPKREPFDIVVFDEASQLPTCKAVGVLARGTDAIIVGDPKQMPPTSFFATNTVDEENMAVEDLESILDDCLALNMPESHLLWHYRSRHESLIAFSNSRFYENKLFTFPSVNDRESKVSLVKVDGVFDRGKTRTNKAEAIAVVEEIKRRFNDPELSKLSLGIVTFNISQQHLIDDLLNEACANDPELEKWAFASDEPLFIKNLENVQGDERDVILFSIGFGPDENGKVYMNFGPLNREGGWRRLNVAVSRARYEMVVFSTLRSEQLDLNRTSVEGVAALRGFLEYAEGRTVALEESELSLAKEKYDGIALSICNALQKNGFETDFNVGRSEYRIDIGVVDPNQPEQYILGIMLDGSGYSNAKTTRDREIAQISVLKGLGWNIMRIWCMDWWDNSEKEIKRIFKKLEDIQNGVQEESEPTPLPPKPADPPKGINDNKQDDNSDESEANLIKNAPVYKAEKLSAETITADEFLLPNNQKKIISKIKAVLGTEAPISLSLLTKRVVQSYGLTRSGTRIQNHFNNIISSMKLKATKQDDMLFYWNSTDDPNAYMVLRKNGEGDNYRDIRDVPVQEVANAIYIVLYYQVSMSKDDLLRETAKELGYSRLGGNVHTVLDLGIRYAQRKGYITPGANGTYILTESGSTRAEDILKSFG